MSEKVTLHSMFVCPENTTDDQIKKLLEKSDHLAVDYHRHIFSCHFFFPTEPRITVGMSKLAEVLNISDETMKSIFLDRISIKEIDDWQERGYLVDKSLKKLANVLGKKLKVLKKAWLTPEIPCGWSVDCEVSPD